MATALLGGHVNRAIDFLRTEGMYFVIGGTAPWNNETSPKEPDLNEFKLKDIVGLKAVENRYLVVRDTPAPDETLDENIKYIQYRDQRWRVIPYSLEEPNIETIVTRVDRSGKQLELESTMSLVAKSRIRIKDKYEFVVKKVEGNIVTVDFVDTEDTTNTSIPEDIYPGDPVLGGAIVDGAKYVYVDCTLSYDTFPVRRSSGEKYSYRQIGLCTGVTTNPDITPKTLGILVSEGFDGREVNEYSSLGVLEVLDNRLPSTRDENQKEQLSLIIEF